MSQEIYLLYQIVSYLRQEIKIFLYHSHNVQHLLKIFDTQRTQKSARYRPSACPVAEFVQTCHWLVLLYVYLYKSWCDGSVVHGFFAPPFYQHQQNEMYLRASHVSSGCVILLFSHTTILELRRIRPFWTRNSEMYLGEERGGAFSCLLLFLQQQFWNWKENNPFWF